MLKIKSIFSVKTNTPFLRYLAALFILPIFVIVLLMSTSVIFAQGTCVSGNCINGNGTYKFQSGATFEGSFKDGNLVKGTYRFTNGDVYNGYFLNNKFHGQGRYHYKQSGNIYNGIYAHGEKTNGTFTYSDGSNYIGSFKNHKKDGKGKLTTATGKVFDGYWDADMYAGARSGNRVQTFAVIAGVADYKNFGPGSGDLNFTATDARKFYQFLQSPQGGKVPAANMQLLIDSDASLENILKAGRKLFAQADENDRIIFFFSGHGSKNGFLPYDVDQMGRNILTHNQVKQLFAASKASVKLVFADACYSGSIRKDVSSKSDPEVLTEIGIKSNLPQSNRKNIAIMLSSDGNQISFEFPTLKQGVFAYYLMKGLTGAADKNNDNLITIAEVYYYVRDNTYSFVRENMRKTQTPILFGNFDKEMIIGVY